MDNVLFVLSPLDSHLLSSEFAIKAARAISSKGAVRADLSIDPRIHSLLNNRAHYHALPNFLPIARNLSVSIFAPMVGQSDVQDFSEAIASYASKHAPDLGTLSTVGKLFADGVNGCARTEGKKLGLVFYAALHARTPERNSYTHLVFPALSDSTHKRFADLLGEMREGYLDDYGPIINLSATRKRMTAVQSPQPKPAFLN